ncbi:MAG: ABC transporter ATP-binding protein [Xanthomonadales bacterium]|nr:ABC transporter ATP-binding protein [Gammaproteobacteria bacterium]MBT8052481.1 ABC transporter ATP-binding protein [Gammaproteobacteria bacterium]NND57145.1 ABC transporter ATP-binding protein [Xanthomonadales bacterium]NNK52795.1 ABC transporter ATP-binding protein [Xanthomonadales bacterium]
MNKPVLSVRQLSVTHRLSGRVVNVLDQVSFDLHQGEILALVGQSGSGKTKTAESILGLLPPDRWDISAQAIELNGSDLAALPESGLRKIRGRSISMIFQEPLTALDPVFTVGNQLCSVFTRHRGQRRREAQTSAQAALGRVGFPDPGHVMRRYPHQLSGGMRQRVMIAMAMACRPSILIADEPTTALDVTTQAQVLDQLVQLGQKDGVSLLLITHDLGIVAQYCDRALVMLDGKIVEQASVEELFANPRHVYTKALLNSAAGAKPK